MYSLTDIDAIKRIMSRHGFSFSKSLGQNFIVDPEVCPEMVRLSGIDKDCGVIEIGAGIGVLTAEIAKNAGKVVSFEVDKRLIPVLNETLADFHNIEIINKDIMTVNLSDVIESKFKGTPVYVCANLPYYITSPVIMTLLKNNLRIKSITVMLQQEAAQRLCAPVGSRFAGAVTVAVDYYANARKLFDVSKECFLPVPKVDSSVIRLDLRSEKPYPVSDEERFFKLVSAAFAQRRKTAVNSVSSGLGVPKTVVEGALRKLSLPENIRAENLTANQLALLSDMI
ncbi:MAG: 16S rRNA (adenine(1518)-N(6)/adenine(1519)-N(6))-dimethyltransferase RsmA [Clostridiales bacterium]|nr:16S rRNA (adenine(1518)-N(6)/adenine(1519)-N(6))-dimethyltransferase RsmA [Clostridiales bacterium]